MSPLPSTGHSVMTFPQALRPELVPVVGAVPGPRAGGSPHPEPPGLLQLWPLSPWRCLPAVGLVQTGAAGRRGGQRGAPSVIPGADSGSAGGRGQSARRQGSISAGGRGLARTLSSRCPGGARGGKGGDLGVEWTLRE